MEHDATAKYQDSMNLVTQQEIINVYMVNHDIPLQSISHIVLLRRAVSIPPCVECAEEVALKKLSTIEPYYEYHYQQSLLEIGRSVCFEAKHINVPGFPELFVS